ncbi:hypothetical protein [Henriciella aquimarina]|uniref:hypothetical protein n=1 Tax=Henriciella aquimarina TaxID=545261 RepID=UPI00117B3508|nr:hypothetical protein [Henriciella aquimarina]
MIRTLIAMAAMVLLAAGLSGPSAAQGGAYGDIIAEMQAKADACAAIQPASKPALRCTMACKASIRTLETSASLTSDQVASIRDKCDRFHANSGRRPVSQPAPATGPSVAARAATMPEKAAWCQSAEARMGCPVDPSEPNWRKREQMCNTAKACGRCGDDRLIARLSSNPVSRDVMTLNRCEENHGAVKAWLDG